MPSSSLFLGAAALSALSATVSATSYTLQDNYSGSSFFDGFTFNNATDPTHGYVQYLSYDDAKKADLISYIDGAAYMGVDYYNTYSLTAQGRPSVRIESAKTYNHGLFIVDLAHMPGTACGSWPAFWSLGDGTWPANGEIDIIEGVNKNTANLQVLHTADNCTIAGSDMTGTLATNDCSVSHSTSGCAVNPAESNTFGDGFNGNGGGVYAMEWTSDAIKMWFFPRGSIPSEVTAKNPDTSKFGTPSSNFQGSCNIDTHFKNHKFIFDTTFCGDWAGNVYSSSGCPTYDGKSSVDQCVQYVAENPTAFEQSYWLINSFKAYSVSPAQSSSAVQSSSRLSSVIPAASTSAFSLTAISNAMGQTTTPSAKAPASTSGLAVNGTAPIPLPSGLASGSLPSGSRPTGSVLPSGSVRPSGSVLPSGSILPSGSKAVNGTRPSVTGSPQGVQYVTEVVTAYTTYCPAATEVVQNGKTYTVTEATTLTIKDCPCTITKPVSTSVRPTATSAKETVTTVITTSYVDVCPTGYTTSVITHTVTYCPADVTSGAPAPPGFTTKVTVCSACGPAPTTVTLTVPVTQPASAPVTSATGSAPAPAPPKSIPAGSNSVPAIASNSGKASSAPAVASNSGKASSAPVAVSSVPVVASSVPVIASTSAKVTQVVTLSVVPVPPTQVGQSSGTVALPAGSSVSAKASYSAPAGGYTVPASGYGGSNKTVAATGTGKASASASYTASPSQFTGAAGETRVFAGMMGGLFAAAAALLL